MTDKTKDCKHPEHIPSEAMLIKIMSDHMINMKYIYKCPACGEEFSFEVIE